MLILTSLKNAITSLREALEERKRVPENKFVRDACIQRFEFTYDLSHKMLKRHLEATAANPAEIDSLTFQGMIRMGSERNLLRSDWEKWKLYRISRGTTSHAYNEDKALEVLSIVPDFYEESAYLLAQLKDQNDG